MRPSELLTGTVRGDDGVPVLELAGALGLQSELRLWQLVEQAGTPTAPSVVVDMALVSSCDVHGLAALVLAAGHVHALGGHLVLRSPPLVLRRLLEITGPASGLVLAPATPSDGLLAADLMAITGPPLARSVLDTALVLVVRMAQAVMTRADGVSITLPRDGRLRTVAASNDVVLQMDHDQYDAGEGPCLDAANHGKAYSSPSLETERRWPTFVPHARARGIEAIMSTPLMSAKAPLGALNVYSRVPRALTAHEQTWATRFAEEASVVLVAAESGGTFVSVQAQVTAGLRSREMIGLAQGIVMVRQQLQPDAAYRFLLDISRQTGRPLLQISQDVVRTAGPGRKAGLRRSQDIPPAGP